MVNARCTGRSSNRASNGPRQRFVAWLGKLDEAGRLGVLRAAEEAKQSTAHADQHGNLQQPLNQQLQFEFDDVPAPQPRWVEVNAAGVRVENLRQFGGPFQWGSEQTLGWLHNFRRLTRRF